MNDIRGKEIANEVDRLRRLFDRIEMVKKQRDLWRRLAETRREDVNYWKNKAEALIKENERLRKSLNRIIEGE